MSYLIINIARIVLIILFLLDGLFGNIGAKDFKVRVISCPNKIVSSPNVEFG